MCSKVSQNRETINRRAFLINYPYIWKVNKSTVMEQWQNILNDIWKPKANTSSRRAVFHEKVMELRQTCNRNASERERIWFLAGRELPKSIKVARGACPFRRVTRTLPGLTSLWAYGGSRLCMCFSPSQICWYNYISRQREMGRCKDVTGSYTFFSF